MYVRLHYRRRQAPSCRTEEKLQLVTGFWQTSTLSGSHLRKSAAGPDFQCDSRSALCLCVVAL